jgi:cytochrome c1
MYEKYRTYEKFWLDEGQVLYYEGTIAAIRRKYWWESLSRDVTEYINACVACAKRKTGKKIVAPLGIFRSE